MTTQIGQSKVIGTSTSLYFTIAVAERCRLMSTRFRFLQNTCFEHGQDFFPGLFSCASSKHNARNFGIKMSTHKRVIHILTLTCENILNCVLKHNLQPRTDEFQHKNCESCE